ncbi:hypothetical protein AMET1_0405 [Methanonatronarchaeum thermophilum]|uniref:Uncharacterized protein n=1 Tax=Methanonatronarchaeum thermophilum TaxID=1927129 RepID=A0A1Y3GH38_9EURY|nr:hypothetical protein [Methanonatronarchaeum thermophilum]OUJ18755.1 hypothetical protein AMET1_0405 [Methanonatronarchaeum thermophilum]
MNQTTNQKNIKIRKARESDAEKTAPLILDAFDTEKELLGKTKEERIKTIEKMWLCCNPFEFGWCFKV